MLVHSAAPENIEGYNTSSTTIRVTWNAMAVHNGQVDSYRVFYQAVGGSYTDSTRRHKQVAGGSTQTDLTGLEEYVLYSISVAASTNAGEEPSSIVITVRTAEDGKLINCHMIRFMCSLCRNCE